MRALIVAAVSVCLVAGSAVPAAAVESTDYVPPVDAPVVDEFRPPSTRYGAGNRGLEYATRPGQTVRAAARGTVSYAGNVAGRLVVSIQHPDGLRTTYTGLASISVGRGAAVDAETPIGTASATLHFGVRAGDAYLDPAALLGGRRRVFLVADELDRRITPAYAEHLFPGGGNPFGDAFGAVVGVIDDIVSDPVEAWGRLLDVVERVAFAIDPGLGHLVQTMRQWNPVSIGLRLIEVWNELQRECTPTSTGVPEPPSERRILVVVGGLSSHDGDGLIDEIAPDRLGYSDGDVVRFSYEGGATPGTGESLGLDERGYDADDTEVGLRDSAELLDELIDDVATAAPGVPIDVVAHSQGGVLSRLAVDTEGGPVERIVTLATPHRGADIASNVTALVDGNLSAEVAANLGEMIDDATGDHIPALASDAVADLGEGSEVIRGLPDVPTDVELTSVASRVDLIVANPQSRVEG
ncbi:MAG: peptidoglycan DD-metalloendopeptidase family protein, partial [Actinomycetota bacterium]